MSAHNVLDAWPAATHRKQAFLSSSSSSKLCRVLPLLAALFALAVAADGHASPPQRAKASLATISNADSGVTYCGESGRYSSLTEAREAMLQFIGKARRCEAIAIGEWTPVGTGAGYSPGSACYGKAFEQTYALCGSGALLRFVFFELPTDSGSLADSSNRLPPVDVPTNRVEAAAVKVVSIRNGPTTRTPAMTGVPQRVVLVNSAPSAAVGR